jgi:hypothetical protein
MKTITLYHGSNQIFNTVDLSKSRDRRDFGRGFYLTTLQEQAEAWAVNMYIRYGGIGEFIYVFEFEESIELNIKRYPELNIEWLEMIKENRTKGGIQHKYDVIYGPVANDNTMRTIALYIAGIYTSEAAFEQLKCFKANDQLSVHTEKALKFLRLIRRIDNGK